MAPSERLLEGIDRLSLPQRTAYLAAYALRAEPSELTRVVADWSTASRFHQRLAIQLASVARRANLLEPLVDDPEVGSAAIVQLTRLGATDPIVSRLDDLPQTHRRAFHQAVNAQRLSEVADAIIAPVRARFGDVEAARIVGACSPQVAAPRCTPCS